MTTPTDDRRDLVTVFASMRAAPGKEDELHQGIEDPAAFYFYENWETAEQLDAHRETPHMTEFAAVLDDLLDESGLTVHRARRIG